MPRQSYPVDLAQSQDNAGRLDALAKSDPGYFVVSVLSFIENWFKTALETDDRGENSDSLRQAAKDYLEKFGQALVLSSGKRAFIDDLVSRYENTHGVRHRFETRSPEEAIAAAVFLKRFLLAHNLEQTPVYELVRELSTSWENRGVTADTQLKELQNELSALKEKHAELLSESSTEAERSADLKKYLEYQQRFISYTRSRRDFEAQVLRLSPEQEAIVERLDFQGAFMVKGAAGSGKSLVLLKALEKVVNERAQELDLDPRSVLFLTYTKTLERYNQYLISLIGQSGVKDQVYTADAYYRYLSRKLGMNLQIDVECTKKAISAISQHQNLVLPEGWGTSDLIGEFRDLLWAGDYSHEEYVVQTISRKGRVRPLSKAERQLVWDWKTAVEAWLDEKNLCDFDYQRVKIWRKLNSQDSTTTSPEGSSSGPVIFVDEAQDLSPVALGILRIISCEKLVLAADNGQRIFQVSSPYSRAGISLQGRSAILRTSFRNTRPILEMAQRWRLSSEQNGPSETLLSAFREGPPPEVISQKGNLSSLVIAKIKQLTGPLGYSPGSVAVLVPDSKARNRMEKQLQSAAIDFARIRNQDFDFASEDQVRLVTLDSSKGLDFPVVLMYLPFWDRLSANPSPEELANARNLLYVGMTRAMDFLGIFVDPSSDILAQVAALDTAKNQSKFI